ncbi:MAG: PASTA domain-containing protein [Thermoanaerobaculia bacterium]
MDTARLPAMMAKVLGAIRRLSYLFLMLILFGVAGYLSFTLFVRRGVTTVPEVMGLSEIESAAILVDQGLVPRLKSESARYDEKVPVNHVVLQSPGPGSLVKRGSSVHLSLSLGQQLVEVPDLAGSALQAVQVSLSSLGLVVGQIANLYSIGAESGTVVQQRPRRGSRVGVGESVDLFLSKEDRGATFLMPDLTYRNFLVVRNFFERRGFRLGTVKFDPYEGVAAGVVLRQYPLPGHPLRRRDIISLVVASSEGRLEY